MADDKRIEHLRTLMAQLKSSVHLQDKVIVLCNFLIADLQAELDALEYEATH